VFINGQTNLTLHGGGFSFIYMKQSFKANFKLALLYIRISCLRTLANFTCNLRGLSLCPRSSASGIFSH